MRFRVYGEVKDTKTGKAVIGANVKLFLNEEELQQGRSAKNGFYELIVDIDDSRIEGGQQLLVTFEMEGYKKQEHRMLATEGAFNLDTKLEAEASPTPKPFNWLPLVIAGGVVLLLVVGVILFLILRPKTPKITGFSADPESIESGQSVTLSWETKKASTVGIMIDQNIVPVDLSGSKKVQPIQTTDYTLIARNEKGETRASRTVEVKDVVPPELAITLSPSRPNMEEKVIFTVTASDPGGINKIEILVDGEKVKECTESPCIYEGGPYSLGSVRYEAYAWDNSENKAVTEPTNAFTIEDITKPEATISVNPSTPTTKEKVTFTATATDPGGIKKLEIYVKGMKAKECSSSPCTYEGGPYPLGRVSYEAHVWDNSDNEAIAGPNGFTTRDIDAPVVKVTHSPLKPNTEEKVTFTATATDPGGISRVEININNKRVKRCSESPCVHVGGPYSLGNVSYEAHAWDRSNQHAVAGPKSFTAVDTGNPKIGISASPAKPSTEEKVTFTATASDPGGISKVQIYVNGKRVEECTGTPCRYLGGPYPLGKVSYYAYAYDKAGNRASSGSKSLKTIDKIPPKVGITTTPFTVNLNQKVTFSATASDAGGISKLQIYVNGRRVKECRNSSCSYTGGPYGLGNVRYKAYAWDRSGNKKQTESKTFTVMNFNFESGKLTGWRRRGTAFNYQPTYGDNPTMRKRGQPSKHQGRYWIGTYEKHPSNKYPPGTVQGDKPTGTLTSRYFVIQSSRANFLVGGGSGSGVRVELLVDGKIVKRARGKNNETMSRVNWDLSKYVNKTARLRIVDNATGAWGHINFDDFQFVRFMFPILNISPIKPLNTIKEMELPKKKLVPKIP